MCVSHTAVIAMLNKLGINHDEDVKRWRDDVCKVLKENNLVCFMLHISVLYIRPNIIIIAWKIIKIYNKLLYFFIIRMLLQQVML